MAKKEYFDSKLGPLFKMTGAICVDRYGNAKAAEVEAINYLNNGSAVGLFPEGTRNGLKEERLKELYELYKNNMRYDEFKMEMPKTTLASQINLLEKLYKEGKITLEEYRDYILTSKESLLKLYEKNIISDFEYKDSILLPFKFGAVSMAQKTGAKIVPFGVTGDYKKNSQNLIVSFSEPFEVSKTDSLEESNFELRERIKKLVYSNINGKN